VDLRKAALCRPKEPLKRTASVMDRLMADLLWMGLIPNAAGAQVTFV
jgi:hypothetical protein